MRGLSSHGDLWTDELSKSDIIKRSYSTLNLFVQVTVTQAVSTLILQNCNILGYTEYQGQNQHDDKVRPLHRKYFDGVKWLSIDNPPPCGNPGDEINCRCFIKAVR
jgi:hypothetical protein